MKRYLKQPRRDEKKTEIILMEKTSKVSLTIAIIGLLIALISAYASYKQSEFAESQLSISREQSETSKRQNQLSEEQNNLSKNQVILAAQQTELSKQQANASNLQVAISKQQTDISQTQYNSTLPNITINVNDYLKSASFFIPILNQTDNLINRVSKDDYRIIIQVDISNLSSLPISITNMYIKLDEFEFPAWKNIAGVKKYNLTNNTSVAIEKEYPDVFVLQPYESSRGYAVFLTNFFPQKEETSGVLCINTSRGIFYHRIKIHKHLGMATEKDLNNNLKFRFEFNSIHNPGTTIFPRLVPVE